MRQSGPADNRLRAGVVGHPSSCDGHRVDLDAVQRTRYIAMGCSRIRQAQLSHWIQPGHRSRTRP
jgi:hypothetical protein